MVLEWQMIAALFQRSLETSITHNLLEWIRDGSDRRGRYNSRRQVEQVWAAGVGGGVEAGKAAGGRQALRGVGADAAARRCASRMRASCARRAARAQYARGAARTRAKVVVIRSTRYARRAASARAQQRHITRQRARALAARQRRSSRCNTWRARASTRCYARWRARYARTAYAALRAAHAPRVRCALRATRRRLRARAARCRRVTLPRHVVAALRARYTFSARAPRAFYAPAQRARHVNVQDCPSRSRCPPNRPCPITILIHRLIRSKPEPRWCVVVRACARKRRTRSAQQQATCVRGVAGVRMRVVGGGGSGRWCGRVCATRSDALPRAHATPHTHMPTPTPPIHQRTNLSGSSNDNVRIIINQR